MVWQIINWYNNNKEYIDDSPITIAYSKKPIFKVLRIIVFYFYFLIIRRCYYGKTSIILFTYY